jgi:type IV pilus assembly protein PilM
MPVLNQKVLGLDIGSSSIKWILYGKRGKKPILYDWGISKIPAGWVRDGRMIDSGGIATNVSEVLKGLRCKVSKVSLSLSCPEMIIRTIYLPKLVPKELEAVVKYEIEQLIPAGAGEYIADYRILGEEVREGAVQVSLLIAAMPSAIIGEYMELFRTLNLKPQFFDFHGNSVSRMVNVLISSQKGDRQLVVDTGASNTTITIVENGATVLTRLLHNGGDEVTRSIANTFNLSLEDAEKQKKTHGVVYSEGQKPEDGFAQEVARSVMPTMQQLLKDIYRSVEFYRSRSGRDLDSVILVGGGSRLKGFGGYIASNLGLNEVCINNELPLLDKAGFSSEQAAVLANVLGLALRGRRDIKKDINLLPEGYRNIRKIRGAKRTKLAAGLLISAIAAGAIILPLYYRSSVKSVHTGILREMDAWSSVMEYRRVRDDLEKLLAEREIIAQNLRSLGKEWSSLLLEIGVSSPVGIRLESISFSEGRTLTIYGTAPDYKTVAQFVVRLNSVEGIEIAEPARIVHMKDGALSFEAMCFVGGEGIGE